MNRVLCVFALVTMGSTACAVRSYDPGPQQVYVPQSSGGQVTTVMQPVYVQPQPVYVAPQPQRVYVQPQQVYVAPQVDNGPMVRASVNAGPNGGGASLGANIPGEGPGGISVGAGPNGGGASVELPGAGGISVGAGLR